MRFRAVLCLSVFSTSAVAAQSMGAHGTLSVVGDTAFGALPGFNFLLEQPVGTQRLQWHLMFDAAQGSRRFTGSPCVRSLPPGTAGCGNQALRITTDMESAMLGLRLALLQHPRASLSLVGDIGIGRIGTKTRDATDSVRLKNWRMVYRPEAGVEARVRPFSSKRWFLSGGAAVGQVRPVRQYDVQDGYSPFDAAQSLHRYWLGIMFPVQAPEPRRRRR